MEQRDLKPDVARRVHVFAPQRDLHDLQRQMQNDVRIKLSMQQCLPPLIQYRDSATAGGCDQSTGQAMIATARSDKADVLVSISNVLQAEKQGAEATLGRRLIDPIMFGLHCLTHGLGDALNFEEGLT